MYISKSIIKNVGEKVVSQFLKDKKVSKQYLESGQELQYIMADLIDTNSISIMDVNEFFYKELMYGKRRHIRVLNLDNCRHILYEEDWLDALNKEYKVNSLEFNNIMTSIPNKSEPQKIVAIHTEYNNKMEIKNINIIFSYYIVIKEKGDSCCYIPVKFDMEKKLITIKAWHRQHIDDNEEFKPGYLVEKTITWLQDNLSFTTKNMTDRYKEILYNMNKGLVKELFEKIPSYRNASTLDEDINKFSNMVLTKMPLENKINNSTGAISLPSGVMDIQDELLKLIQRLAVADYFMRRDYDAVWDMGISAVVNSVKFNAIDNVLAVISGEEKRKPVFCSSSFLVLLKSMEQSQMVDTIWVAFRYEERTIRVNYDASNPDYFEITNLSGHKNFTQEEFDYIWEVLMQYESDIDAENKTMDRAIVG